MAEKSSATRLLHGPRTSFGFRFKASNLTAKLPIYLLHVGHLGKLLAEFIASVPQSFFSGLATLALCFQPSLKVGDFLLQFGNVVV